ncbi:MAG: DUF2232 domain-containing protein [Gemmatimonadales bacterium]|nr:MAG: DUF2232 domain-containing protein [Gemmatimonadales bacterium]
MAARIMSSVLRFGVLVVALSVSPVSPLLLVLIPLGVMLVALRPNDISALLTGLLMLVLAFASGVASPGSDWFAQRAWALLLAGGFVVATLTMRHATLLGRSLWAVLIGGVAVAAAGAIRPEVLAGLDGWMAERVQLASVLLLEWTSSVDSQPDVAASMARAITTWAEVQTQVYPAFLALGSLPALALGWYLLGRLTGRPEEPKPIRAFRFNDHLVWLFAAGLAVYALPLGEAAARIGLNATVFMVALYVVRGVAIGVWILGAAGVSSLTWALLAIAAVLLYPVALGATFAVGVGDTWLNVRGRLERFAISSAGD